jgi:hydrogenase maturation protease
MPDLRQQLERLRGRICFMGLGNTDYCDDGFGVRLAEKLIEAAVPDVIVARTAPERWISRLSSFDHAVFLDAVDFGGAPGDVIFLDSAEITPRFPQISTHKISLGLLAQWIEAQGLTKAWLLGVQPESLTSPHLSSSVQKTLDVLCVLIKTTDVGTVAVHCPEEPLASGVNP